VQGLMNYEQAAKYLGIAEITLKKCTGKQVACCSVFAKVY